MPLLARFVTAPLVVDVRRGALAELGRILADQRISTSGRVAIAVGRTYGPVVQRTFEHDLVEADWFTVEGGTINTAVKLVEHVRQHRDAPPPGSGCRWSRSPRISRTTASRRRSAPWTTTPAVARTASLRRSPSSSTST